MLLVRYYQRCLLARLARLMAMVLGLAWVLEWAGQLHAMHGHYQLATVTLYATLLLARNAERLLPLVVLLGTLWTLMAWQVTREWGAYAALGVAPEVLKRASFVALAVGTVSVALLGEGVGPWATHYAKAMKARALSRGQVTVTRRGFWWKDGDCLIHGVFRRGGLRLLQPFWLCMSDGQITSLGRARIGHYREGYWEVQDARITQVRDWGMKPVHSPVHRWATLLTPALLRQLSELPDRLSLKALWQQSALSKRLARSPQAYQDAFWARLLQPWLGLALVWLVSPVLFRPERYSRSVWITATLLGGGAGFVALQMRDPLLAFYSLPSWTGVAISALMVVLLRLALMQALRVSGQWLVKRSGQ